MLILNDNYELRKNKIKLYRINWKYKLNYHTYHSPLHYKNEQKNNYKSLIKESSIEFCELVEVIYDRFHDTETCKIIATYKGA